MKRGSRNDRSKQRRRGHGSRKRSPRRVRRTTRLRAKSQSKAKRAQKNARALNNRRRQAALRAMAMGKSLAESAHSAGMPVRRLHDWLRKKKLIRRVKGEWVLVPGIYRRMRMYSDRQIIDVLVSARTASRIGKHHAAVKAFLGDQNLAHLAPFEGRSIKDTDGKLHRFEVGPNELYELDNTEGDPFEEMYEFIF